MAGEYKDLVEFCDSYGPRFFTQEQTFNGVLLTKLELVFKNESEKALLLGDTSFLSFLKVYLQLTLKAIPRFLSDSVSQFLNKLLNTKSLENTGSKFMKFFTDSTNPQLMYDFMVNHDREEQERQMALQKEREKEKQKQEQELLKLIATYSKERDKCIKEGLIAFQNAGNLNSRGAYQEEKSFLLKALDHFKASFKNHDNITFELGKHKDSSPHYLKLYSQEIDLGSRIYQDYQKCCKCLNQVNTVLAKIMNPAPVIPQSSVMPLPQPPVMMQPQPPVMQQHPVMQHRPVMQHPPVIPQQQMLVSHHPQSAVGFAPMIFSLGHRDHSFQPVFVHDLIPLPQMRQTMPSVPLVKVRQKVR